MKDTPSARNRFIYYPDHLVRLPGPGPGRTVWTELWSLCSEPIWEGRWKAMLEPGRESRPATVEDESIGAFLERRFGGPQLGDNVVSALLHGIYAGDIYKLSAKSLLFNKLWKWELEHGSVMHGAAKLLDSKRNNQRLAMDQPVDDPQSSDLDEAKEYAKGVSIYTFYKGISSLSMALEKNLRRNRNVQFKLNTKADKVTYDGENKKIKVPTRTPFSSYTFSYS